MQITLQRSGVKTLVAGGRASTQAMSEGNLGMTEGRNATGLGSMWGLDLAGGLCYRGHGAESAFNSAYARKSWQRFDQGRGKNYSLEGPRWWLYGGWTDVCCPAGLGTLFSLPSDL